MQCLTSIQPIARLKFRLRVLAGAVSISAPAATLRPVEQTPARRERLRQDKARLERTVADLGVEQAFMADKLRARDAEALGAQQELDAVHARLAKTGVDYVRARLCHLQHRV